MTYDFDFFVIGGGSGGTRAARIAAGHGARVGVAEERYWGGTCVNVGCIPKKLFVYAAHAREEIEDAAGFGWAPIDPKLVHHSWPALVKNKDVEITRLKNVYRRLIEGAGAKVFEKRARLIGPHRIELRAPGATAGPAEAVTAEKILIATGGWPTMPDVPGKALAFTSNEAFHLERFPERVIIVGGGYVAVEFAGIFHGLGAEVTLLYRGPLFLRGFDDDARLFLAEEMRKKGIDLRFNTDVARIAARGAERMVSLASGEQIAADGVMYATGRHPNSRGIGLEELGVGMSEDGAIEVDGQWKTSVRHIFAIGDVTDRINLTPVATAEGHALADRLFRRSGRSVNYENVPSTVFSQPNLGSVGLTEDEARRRHGTVEVFRSTFRPLKHTLSGRGEQAMMKLIVDEASRRVLGLHMVGPEAGEIVQGFAVAIGMGATKADFDATIGIHPTAAEEFVTMRTPTTGLWELPKAAE